MKLSPAGLKLLRVEEGVRLKAYQDIAGIWTIGVGQTMLRGRPVQEGDTLTEEELQSLLSEQIAEREEALNEALRVPVTQSQFDALFSWTWNVGIGAMRNSTLMQKLNAGDVVGAADEFRQWIKVTIRGERQDSPALRARRERERALFLSEVSNGVQEEGQTPAEKVTTMPVPAVVASGIAAVLPKLLEALPWFSSGSPTAERNVKLAQTVGPVLVDMAKKASGEAGIIEAAARLDEPAVKQKYVALAAERWDELRPRLEFEEASRVKARDFFERVTATGPKWRQIGFSVVLLVAAGMILGLFGAITWQLVFDTATPVGLKERLVDKWDLFAAAVVFYLFGSSAGSRMKDNRNG